MASSQQKLFDLQKEISLSEKKIEYYKHYSHADYGYLCGIKRLVTAYEKDKNLDTLVQGLDNLITVYDMMKRRYVSSDSCSGKYNELCETHLLHLTTPLYSTKGDIYSARCPLYV